MNPIISKEDLKKIFIQHSRGAESRLTFILGAGASLGYSRTENFDYRPPIVSQLLDSNNLIVHKVIEKPDHAAIKGHRAHIQRSISSHGGDLEAYLSDIYENDSMDDLFSYMLRYLEEIFTEASLRIDLEDNFYQGLLSRVRDLRGQKKWSFINFNYDTLLEQSIESLPRFVPPRSFTTDISYLESNPKVIKIHGGVNLRYIQPIDPNQNSRPSSHEIFSTLMSNANPIETYMEVNNTRFGVPEFLGHRNYENIGGRSVINFPLMMIPVHTSVKCGNSFFARQIEEAKKDISESKLVISIGYQFGDKTFTDALKDLDLKESILVLVGSRSLLKETVDSKSYKEASKIWPKDKIYIYEGNGFGNFVDSLY